MRKLPDLEHAVRTAQSPEQVIQLLDVWQGRISEFWGVVVQHSSHWNEALAMGAAHSGHVAIGVASNEALPPELGEKMGGWFANRIFGDTLEDVRDPAFFALVKLAERGMIHADSTATTIILNHIGGKRPSASWSNAEIMSTRVLGKIHDLTPAIIHMLLEKLRVRPWSGSTGVLQAKLGLHRNAGPQLWRQVVNDAWPGDGRPDYREERYQEIPVEIAKRAELRADNEIRTVILERALINLPAGWQPPYPFKDMIYAYAADGGAENEPFIRWAQANPRIEPGARAHVVARPMR